MAYCEICGTNLCKHYDQKEIPQAHRDLQKAEDLLYCVLSPSFYAQSRQKRGEAIEKFLNRERN
jgi:hypothetical protein